MFMKSFKVDMTIRENGGVFTPLVDRIKGVSPEEARDLLDAKYCYNKKIKGSLFDRMGKAVEIASDRFDEIIKDEEVKEDAPNDSNR